MSKLYNLVELNANNLKEFLYYKECKNISDILDNNVLKELGFSYSIIYNYDGIVTDKIDNIKIDIDNIIEARFFNETSEIRIFNEGELFGTIFKENNNSSSIKKKSLVSPRYQKKKNYVEKIIYKEYINYDDDNQAYISYMKPVKLCFKEGK